MGENEGPHGASDDEAGRIGALLAVGKMGSSAHGLDPVKGLGTT